MTNDTQQVDWEAIAIEAVAKCEELAKSLRERLANEDFLMSELAKQPKAPFHIGACIEGGTLYASVLSGTNDGTLVVATAELPEAALKPGGCVQTMKTKEDYPYYNILAITTAYEQGFGHATREELNNPYKPGTPTYQAWNIGRTVGRKPADNVTTKQRTDLTSKSVPTGLTKSQMHAWSVAWARGIV